MKACTAAQMRAVDKAAFERGCVPGIVLMENAALSCIDELFKDFPDIKKKRIAVFCGKGNNGGDGLCIARHLFNRGVYVSVFLAGSDDYTQDAGINYDILSRMPVEITLLDDSAMLEYIIPSFDIVIDAIYGTGIHGIVRSPGYEIIEAINKYAAYVMSVDIPSGINADTGEVCGVCIKADKTVTFGAYKLGMLLYPGADFTGEIVVKGISIPQYIIDESPSKIYVSDKLFAKKAFPKRVNNSQKGDYGKVFIIAGSKGMTGAAYLSSLAALNTGSGLITLGIPESLNPVLESKTTEVMTYPLADNNGRLSRECIPAVLEQVKKSDAVLIGPGLGQGDDIYYILKAVLENSFSTVIIDADGINVLSKHIDILSAAKCNIILTPHCMEMSRLTGIGIDEIEKNRIGICSDFADRYGVTLILKGHHTLVTAPDQTQYINITGNSGLATGGSGDVLAGIILSLTGRGMSEEKAAALGVYLHGAAGDIAAEKYGENSMTPTNVVECISSAVTQILQVEI